MTNEERRAALRQRARQVLEHNASVGVRAPEFGADKDWLNVSRSLSSSRDLAGKLVLLDFWTYCCINCMHVLPDLAWLEDKYAGEPFVVVGCHSAKFANEADLERVREAVLRERVEHPVVVDRDFDLWKRFAVRAWPTLMLLSPDGRILGQVAGEGQLAVLDVLIEQALELYHARDGALDRRALPLRSERSRVFPRELSFPGKVLADGTTRRLYVADSGHHRVLELDLDGRFLRQFGSGEPGFVDGDASDARLRGPQGLALTGGALIVADTLNHALRRIDLASGVVETLAGNGRPGYERERALPARGAALNSPWDVRVHGDSVLIAMAGAHQVWSYDPATESVRPLAGDGSEQLRNGAFELAGFAQPSGLAVHGSRAFVADSESSSVRELELATRRVRTLVGGSDDPRDLFQFGDEDGTGSGKRLEHPLGIECDPLAPAEHVVVYVADTYNHRIKLVDPDAGAISRYAGTGEAGFADGDCDDARFCEPGGLSLAGRTLFVADTNNHALRAIDLEEHVVRTLSLEGVPVPLWRREVALDVAALPQLPQTVVHAQRKRRLPPGDAELVLAIELAPGERLAPDAPSQFRVHREGGLVAAKSVAGHLRGPETAIPLGVAGPGLLRVQAHYYVCDERGRCHLRSHEWRLDVEEHERAPARTTLSTRAAE